MSDRRRTVADAGLLVLAKHGLRGVTHRAVDAAAELPPGSTSNVFRSRQALIDGLVARLVELDLEAMEAGDMRPDLSSPTALAHQLANQSAALTRPPLSTLTRARLELALHPDIDLGAQHLGFVAMLVPLLEALGAEGPERRARMIADYLDGLIFHALTMRARGFDPEDAADAIEALIGEVRTAPSNVDKQSSQP
ncbi:TetR/AcrR family transcriptional regulator [Granulicoccus sp. GXG6511]|uniref:TetR/AcrR family transcriptional regulator n=1 Tax=Granulicoccus sp. GXG6511 TaxID=3381351 RepID=UPI003D7EEC61